MSAADLNLLTRPGENAGVVEKKVLLAHLARAEAERLGIRPSPHDTQALADALRAELGLVEPEATHAWLAAAGLDESDFAAVVADLASVLAVARHYREALAAPTNRHARFVAARARTLSADGSG